MAQGFAKPGYPTSPTFTDVIISSLTASRLVASDAAKKLVSVADLASWIAGTANQITVAADGGGGVTLSAPQDLTAGGIAITDITQITNRSHTNLTDIGAITHATIDSYLDQTVKQASSPTFAGLTLTGFSGFVRATAGVLSASAIVDADVPDTITLANITQITTRSHTSLTDIGTLSHATIDSYLDQAVKQASSPVFATVKLSGLTDGYIPYHVADATGLADSPIFTNGTNIGIGTANPANVKLGVIGDVILANSDFNGYALGGAEDTGTGILISRGAASGNTYGIIQVYTAGDSTTGNLVLNNQGGNVGIGVVSPAVKLDVEKSDGVGRQNVAYFLAGDNTAGNGASIALGSTQTLAGFITGLQTQANEGDLIFGVQSAGAYSEKMRISGSTGDVDIVQNLTCLIAPITSAGGINLSTAQVKGQVVYITAAGTVGLPAVVIGSSVTVYCVSADAIHVDPDANDRIILDGVALGDGNKISSPGVVGSLVTLHADSAAGWTVVGRVGAWIDGG